MKYLARLQFVQLAVGVVRGVVTRNGLRMRKDITDLAFFLEQIRDGSCYRTRGESESSS